MMAEQQHELSCVERGNGFKAAVGGPAAAGGDRMDVRMEIQAVSVALHRNYDTGKGGRIGGDFPGHLLDGLPSGFAEQPEVFRVIFENGAQKLGDRKNILVMADFFQDVIVEPFGEQQDTLLLA